LVFWLQFELNQETDPVTKERLSELDKLCGAVTFIGIYLAMINTYRHKFFKLLEENYPQLSDTETLEILQEYTAIKLRNSPEFSRRDG
jgi:hypothetical protein